MPTHVSWLAVFWLVICFLWSSVRGAVDSLKDEQVKHQVQAGVPDQAILVDSIIELHETVVTVETLHGEPNTPRHRRANAKLHDEMSKSHGTYNIHHPRYRLLDALWGFVRYHDRQMEEVNRIKKLYKNVSRNQRTLLEKHISYSSKFTHIEHHLQENQRLCDRIVENALDFYTISRVELEAHIAAAEKGGRKADKVSVSQALKHIVRDWTDAGASERDGPFECIMGALDDMSASQGNTADLTKILLPGAGLGRLGHEIARKPGFEVTVNEWSMYMNVAYRFLETNRLRNTHSFRPFIDGWSHHATDKDMQRQLQFPDTAVNATSGVLAEGDFTTAFKDQVAEYDVVLTYFFIDTARNLMSYFETIKKLLKPGGHWINLGPLLYGTAPFVQLSLEDIAAVTEAMGFRYLDTDDECGQLTLPGRTVRTLEAVYGFDERALTKSAYAAQFWVAQKV